MGHGSCCRIFAAMRLYIAFGFGDPFVGVIGGVCFTVLPPTTEQLPSITALELCAAAGRGIRGCQAVVSYMDGRASSCGLMTGFVSSDCKAAMSVCRGWFPLFEDVGFMSIGGDLS